MTIYNPGRGRDRGRDRVKLLKIINISNKITESFGVKIVGHKTSNNY